MDEAIARYPKDHHRSATMPLLHLWQEHFGFISDEAIFWIAEKLGLQPINILEVVTFYPMFRQHPAGNTHIVARGETLTSIAKLYKVTVDELQNANHIEDGRKLQAGQTIIVPAASPAPSSSPSPTE